MTPVTFLLDTSALLLHYFKAPRADRIHRIISDEKNSIIVASVSITELGRRLVTAGCDPALASRARIPLVDALIAACASICDATLVHRDDHFLTIPEDLLQQVDAAA